MSSSSARRWRRLAAVLVGLVVLITLFYLEEDWRGQSAWEQYQRASAARGEPLDRAAVTPAPARDEENFAMTPFLAGLFDFDPGTRQWRGGDAQQRAANWAAAYNAAASRISPSKRARTNSWVLGRMDLPAWGAAFLQPTNRAAAWKETVSTNLSVEAGARVVLAGLAECEPVLKELREASRRPRSRFNVAYEDDNPMAILLPHLATLKHVCVVVQLRASAELALGQTNAAFEDVDLMFRLTDALRDEPILISKLVRIAEVALTLQPLAEGLAGHAWSDAQLRAFQERLERFDFCADCRRALQCERALLGGGFLEYLRRVPNKYRVMTGMGSPDGSGQPPETDWPAAVLTVAPSGWLYFEQVAYCRMFQDYLLPIIDVPGRRFSPAASRKAEAQVAAMTSGSWLERVLRHQYFSTFLLPSLSRAAQRSAFAQTAVDSAALACALERYRLAHGQFPEALAALVPEFMDKLPHDVINGQPLKYRRTEGGQYLLYSVGWNETDEGGVLGLTSSGPGVDPAKGDWVWRLPAAF